MVLETPGGGGELDTPSGGGGGGGGTGGLGGTGDGGLTGGENTGSGSTYDTRGTAIVGTRRVEIGISPFEHGTARCIQ
ncbi:MAG: hypothetical protein R3268_10150, partial [Acidiferrobacterales bacterium]|nr:hypothetical protein [Acidiferrobacterales bacterium]